MSLTTNRVKINKIDANSQTAKCNVWREIFSTIRPIFISMGLTRVDSNGEHPNTSGFYAETFAINDENDEYFLTVSTGYNVAQNYHPLVVGIGASIYSDGNSGPSLSNSNTMGLDFITNNIATKSNWSTEFTYCLLNNDSIKFLGWDKNMTQPYSIWNIGVIKTSNFEGFYLPQANHIIYKPDGNIVYLSSFNGGTISCPSELRQTIVYPAGVGTSATTYIDLNYKFNDIYMYIGNISNGTLIKDVDTDDIYCVYGGHLFNCDIS